MSQGLCLDPHYLFGRYVSRFETTTLRRKATMRVCEGAQGQRRTVAHGLHHEPSGPRHYYGSAIETLNLREDGRSSFAGRTFPRRHD